MVGVHAANASHWGIAAIEAKTQTETRPGSALKPRRDHCDRGIEKNVPPPAAPPSIRHIRIALRRGLLGSAQQQIGALFAPRLEAEFRVLFDRRQK